MNAVRTVPVSAALTLLALCLAACAREAPPPAPAPAAPSVEAAPPLAAPPLANPEEAAPVPLAAIPHDGIAESAASRDPFRAQALGRALPPADTRPRKSRRYAVDQLKLVGLVTNTAPPRAMLVDPTGKGWVVTPGEIVGRPEIVSDSGDAASWRVDRIRTGDMVLVREDAAHRSAVATRVVVLHDEPSPLAADD